MKISFSEKQKDVWRHTIKEFHRWNISYGAVRSGKTYLDYWKIPWRIRNASTDGLILLLGNTQGTLERNILDPLRQIWGVNLVSRIGSNNKVYLFDRECYALGADKSTQVDKLRGSGLVYAYGDEITTWNPEVFQMLKSRLDKPGACFDGTNNPDNPNHWVKKFIESDADIYATAFTIDDNPFNDPVFVENLKKEYRGTVFYQRLIDGLWVAAEGIIYGLFANDVNRYLLDIEPKIIFSTIGVDFGGNKSAQAFNCTGFMENFRGIVTLDEYYNKKEIDPAGLERDFVEFVKRQIKAGHKVIEIFADSAEQVLIRGLRNALIKAGIGIPIRNALKGEITERIRLYTALIGSDRYKIMRHCERTIDAFATALWDEKKNNDTRLDDGTTNIDSLDAAEYAVEKYQRQLLDMALLKVVNNGN